jgi:hypothetical protein
MATQAAAKNHAHQGTDENCLNPEDETSSPILTKLP